MTEVEVFSFAVYPADFDDSFDAFILEVPTLSGEEAAARRAWWQVFHYLGQRGFEPEDFAVCAWRDNKPGPPVGMGGFV